MRGKPISSCCCAYDLKTSFSDNSVCQVYQQLHTYIFRLS